MHKKKKIIGLIYIILYAFASLTYANNTNYTKGFETEPNITLTPIITPTLSPTTASTQNNQSTLLKKIEDSISNNQLATALDNLDTINTNNLTKKELAKYHMLRAEIFANNNIDTDIAPSEANDTDDTDSTDYPNDSSDSSDLSASGASGTSGTSGTSDNPNITEKTEFTPVQSTELSQFNNINYLWSNLITQKQSTLDTLKNKIINNKLNLSNLSKARIFNNSDINDQHTILGWLELASITKNIDISLSNSNNFDQQIADWQQKFVNHPAKNYINNSFITNKNTTIVVLLPLTGRLSNTANAIKQGIITAYYQDPNQKKPELIFIDTKNKPKDIQKHYEQALSYNPNFIIGPLDKSSVDTIAQNNNTPIIVALNYLSDNLNLNQNNNSNFFQFGISAEDEAEQAAYKAWNDGYKKALLFTDGINQQWSERISSVYKNKYQQIGGKIANTIKIKTNTNIKSLINNLLDTETSLARKKTLELIINNKLAFVPRRRQDIDHVFLVASPTIAKQIKPILKFYYADDLPVISTSNIYSYKNNFANNVINDLDGILFCDIPWVIQSETNLNNSFVNLNSTWKEQANFNKNIRLYALGVDAYNLSYNLSKLVSVREIGIDSNTGHLYLDKKNKIHRLLAWAIIQDGKPQEASKLANL